MSHIKSGFIRFSGSGEKIFLKMMDDHDDGRRTINIL